MFGVTGIGMGAVKYFSNDGKRARWNRDLWDRVSFFGCLFFFGADDAAIGTVWANNYAAKYVT